MGSSASTVLTNTVNDAVTSVVMTNSSNCTAKTGNSQELSFSDIDAKGCSVDFSNITQDMKVNQNFSCLQESGQSADIVNKIMQEIEAKAKATTAAFPIGSSESTTVTNTLNRIRSDVKLENIANCVAESINNQKQKFEKIRVECPPSDPKLTFKNIGQKLIATQVAKCSQGNKQLAEIATELDQQFKVSAESTTGIDFFGSLSSLGALGALAGPLVAAIVGAIICILSLISLSSASSAGTMMMKR